MYIFRFQVLLGYFVHFIFCSKNIIFLDLNIPLPFSYNNLPRSFNVTLVNPLFTPEHIAFTLIKSKYHFVSNYQFSGLDAASLHEENGCTFETEHSESHRDGDVELPIKSIVVYGVFHFCHFRNYGAISLTNLNQFPTGVTLLLKSAGKPDSIVSSHSNADGQIANDSFLSRRFYYVDYLPTIINQSAEATELQLSSEFNEQSYGRRTYQRQKRSVNDSPIDPVRVWYHPGQPEPYVMELYMIIDETLAAEFRGHYDRLIHRVNMIISIVNGLFARFNVIIVVVRLEIWEHDRIRLNVEEHHLLTTLAQFKRMYANVRHDCLHALLGVRDQGSRMRGKANHQTMCVYSRCVGYSRDSSDLNVVETARTVAHEIGHNFGLRHDTEECECQGCIMATGVEFGTSIMEWSPCSVSDLPGLLKYGMGACLKDLPVRGHVAINTLTSSNTNPTKSSRADPATETSAEHRESVMIPSVVTVYAAQHKASSINSRHPTRKSNKNSIIRNFYDNGLCGNGQLDPGEECDCGTQKSCPDEWKACCDVVNCRLKQGSECAGGPCCHIMSYEGRKNATPYCTLKASGTICRKESNSCDLPEYCDGHSQWCPADVYKADGESCYTTEGSWAYCVRGSCRDANSWCRVLWGRTAKKAHPSCFHQNQALNYGSKIDSVANCGVKRPLPADRWEDVKSWPGRGCPTWYDAECGRLWCHHQNEKAMLLGWIQTQTRVVHVASGSCFALVYDPVWPISDPATLEADAVRQINANGAGYGVYSANTQDAGMVPDGTPCSRGFCYNGSCHSLSEFKSRSRCNCKGYGVCNNLGHCHCFSGFKMPDCEYGGNGGSIDSGPPPKVKKDNALLIAICVLMFVAFPLVIGLVYWFLIRPGRCTLIVPKQIVYTRTGLQTPFDEGCAHFFMQCCSPPERSEKQWSQHKPYPLLAYQTDGQDQQKLDTFQQNGQYTASTNGAILPSQSTKCGRNETTKHSVQNVQQNVHRIGSNKTSNRRTEYSLDTSKQTQYTNKPNLKHEETASGQHIYANLNSNYIANYKDIGQTNDPHVEPSHAEATDDKFNHSYQNMKPTAFISKPKLNSTTYQGKVCSLIEAMTLPQLRYQSVNHSEVKNKANHKTATHFRDEIHCKDQTNIGRSISPSDISKPVLQTTSYTENVIDLHIARSKLQQRSCHHNDSRSHF